MDAFGGAVVAAYWRGMKLICVVVREYVSSDISPIVEGISRCQEAIASVLQICQR